MTDGERDAACGLLMQPLVIAAAHPALHLAVRRHQAALTTMFRTYLGYRLQVDGRSARLYKAGLGAGRGRPVTRAAKESFTPRDYTYLVLVCAVLLTSSSQMLLSNLAEEVRQAAAEAGVGADVDTLAERRALVHALRYLIDLGGIKEDDGTVSGFGDDPATEALLWIERDAVRALIATPLRDADTPADLIAAAVLVDDDSVRHAVRRRIVENPVVSLDELSAVEVAWLRQDQRREARILEENLGLELEIRAEGVAAIDPSERLTDRHFPGAGTTAQAALLTLGRLVEQTAPNPAAADVSFSVEVPPGLLQSTVGELVESHARHWSKELVSRPDRLAAEIAELLADVGLARYGDDGSLWVTAVAARYAPHPEVMRPADPDPKPALF